MKFIILILVTIVVIKSQSSCDFDNKTVQLFWEKEHWIYKHFPMGNFLYYHKIKRKLESISSLNHPNLHCYIDEICYKNFSNFEKLYEACSYFEENYDYGFGNGLLNDIDLALDGINFSDYELDSEFYSELYYESSFGCYSFCEMFFMFEHKTKFVFLVDRFELWLFSYRNFTIHSNQLTKKTGNSFFTTR